MKITTLSHRLAKDARDDDGALLAALGGTARLLGDRRSPLLALRVFQCVRPMVRTIVVRKFAENFEAPGRIVRRVEHDEVIFREFIALAADLGVVVERRGLITANPRYVRHGRWHVPAQDARGYGLARSWVEGESNPPTFAEGDLPYLLMYIRYLLAIEDVDLCRRVPTTFDPSFYSDLGRLAFDNYARQNFENLARRLAPGSFLDVGCGDGRQVAAVRRVVPASRGVGYEMNHEVAGRTAEAFATDGNVEIRAERFLDHGGEPEAGVDLVLCIYMIFYLTKDERVALWRRIAGYIADGGALVVGQYFPDIGDIQRALMPAYIRTNPLQRFLFRVSTSVLKGEVLLNAALSDFPSVAYFGEFLTELDAAGLVIDEIVPADTLYYSFYFVCRNRAVTPKNGTPL